MSQFTEEQLRAIEQQLRCPSGDMGIEVGQRMNNSNKAMIDSTIDSLQLQAKEVVLELGHGNGQHIHQLLEKATPLHYYGLDISTTMHEQALLINQPLMEKHALDFQLYDGVQLPLEDNSIDKIMTVNTIYFWTQPEQLMQEIGRVLRPNGRAIITFAHKSYMEAAATVGELFTIVDRADIQRLVAPTNLEIVEFVDLQDQTTNSLTQLVKRDFCLAILAGS
ncbi:MAG: class I SAM-dependent methyltransferase [Aureispira sp.]